jgi:uncharacterized surface protein with fasciclin (FAS1) repeats
MKKSVIAAALLAAACDSGGGGGNAVAPEANGAAPQTQAQGKTEQPKSNLLQTLGAAGEHKTFANAVEAAGLTETLSGAQPYTVFAPTEAAFQKLPAGTASGLLAPEAKGRLVALLTAHIVPGVVMSEDLGRAVDRGKGKAQLATVGGVNLTFSRSGDSILLSDGGGQGRLVHADRLAANGVIHGIDSVLGGK